MSFVETSCGALVLAYDDGKGSVKPVYIHTDDGQDTPLFASFARPPVVISNQFVKHDSQFLYTYYKDNHPDNSTTTSHWLQVVEDGSTTSDPCVARPSKPPSAPPAFPPPVPAFPLPPPPTILIKADGFVDQFGKEVLIKENLDTIIYFDPSSPVKAGDYVVFVPLSHTQAHPGSECLSAFPTPSPSRPIRITTAI